MLGRTILDQFRDEFISTMRRQNERLHDIIDPLLIEDEDPIQAVSIVFMRENPAHYLMSATTTDHYQVLNLIGALLRNALAVENQTKNYEKIKE